MQFLKKHYEKILLSVVLLGLAGAAGALPWQVSHERDRLEEIRRNLTVKVKAKPFKPLDDWLTTNKTVMTRLQSPLNLELSGPHNLFNPVQWKKRPDGGIVPIRTGSELGPGAIKIAQIKELLLTVSYEGAEPPTSPGEPVKYHVKVLKETDKNARADSRKVTMANPHLNIFDLVSVQGATNEPTALVLKLKDDFESITVSKDKPYSRIIGYAADLSYPPGKQNFAHKKAGDSLKLEDDPETYKIVAITRNEVVLSADSNKRRTILKANASSTTASNTTPFAPSAK
jgi:hypothetical protein